MTIDDAEYRDRQLRALEARARTLEQALLHAIEVADGYCDDEHGHPAIGLDVERALVAR